MTRAKSGAWAALFFILSGSLAAAEPLKIAYSDWPGWVAWDVADKKGFFKDAGVDVQLLWFDYGPSMDAFSAGKVDAVCVTNGDALVTASSGAPNVEILVNDYSNGNDQVIAKPGIASMKDLKGKKIGVEVGLVDHLLLLKGLQMAGLAESDVKLVPIQTTQAAQVLASGDVDAVAAWEPNAGQAVKAVAGAKILFSSADAPGLIYDTLAVNPTSLAQRKADWAKVVGVWYRTAAWILDPKNATEALGILAARDNLKPAEYAAFVNGTKILTLAEAKKVLAQGPGLDSIYGSSKIVDAFNVANKVYTAPQKIESNIDPSFVLGQK
jgi:NitT/TauT family transport system substrate-binding protein